LLQLLDGDIDVGASRDGVDHERGCRDSGPDDDYIAGAVHEPRDGRLAQRDGVGGRGDRRRVALLPALAEEAVPPSLTLLGPDLICPLC
jgi:hypothetical protein